jgi:hypothetical protein
MTPESRRIPEGVLERYLTDALPAEAKARVEALLAESPPDRTRLEELHADSAAFLVKHPPGPLLTRFAGQLPEGVLERYLADALDPQAKARVEALLAVSPELRARLDELRADSAAFFVRHPPGPLVARFQEGARRRKWWRWSALLAPVLAAAAVVLLLLPHPVEPWINTKGPVVLVLHRKTDSGSAPVSPEVPLAPGDNIRFEAKASASGFLAVLGKDAKGTVTVYHPYGGTAAAPYDVAQPRLEGAIELDDTLGREDVYALHSTRPFDLGWAVRALTEGRPLTEIAPEGVSVGSTSFTKQDNLSALSPAFVVPERGPRTKRLALIVGSDTGWEKDGPLLLTEPQDETSRLSTVLTELGGFSEAGVVLLRAPTTEQLRLELEAVKQRLRNNPEEAHLFVFYYVGYADKEYLHLQGKPLSFTELSRLLSEVPATVNLGIIDTVLSGFEFNPASPRDLFQFTVTAKKAARSTVILAESGGLGSIFTHHLVNGLRGAADDDHDLRVSLDEAVRHASIHASSSSSFGTPPPQFPYEASKLGKLVLTQLQGPSALLMFPPGSHCIVEDGSLSKQVAAVFPDSPGFLLLAVPPGTHLLECGTGHGRYRVAPLNLNAGDWVDITQLVFHEGPPPCGSCASIWP